MNDHIPASADGQPEDGPRSDDELDELIGRVDLDALVRLIGDRSDAEDWEGLDRVRRRAIAATRDTGRQLWPAATLAEYRLALDSPPEWAATVLDGEAGRFTIGPLSEVAAINHTWADLAPQLEPNPTALYIAHERAIRGEDIDPDSIVDLPPVLDIPVDLQPWEPDYPLSTYTAFEAVHDEPPRTGSPRPVTIDTHHAEVVDDDDTESAVRQLFDAWSAGSTGRVETLCVEGDVNPALGALGLRSARVTPIPSSEALAELAWAGATGAAHGRRRGMANGRYSMWWLLGAIGDLEWPPHNDEVVELLGQLDWYRWDAHEPMSGWWLQLAVHSRTENLTWVINARDE